MTSPPGDNTRPPPDPNYSARTLQSITEIDQSVWDAFIEKVGSGYNPFVSYAFLEALETSGSVAPETGWTPFHLILEKAGKPVGACPLLCETPQSGRIYIRSSLGERLSTRRRRLLP